MPSDREQMLLEALSIIAGERQSLDNLMGDKDIAIEALRLARAQPAPPPTWQPIATAPKDAAVIVYSFGYAIGHYNTELKRWVRGWDHSPIQTPTHWMPLPAPPQEPTDA